MFPVRSLCTTPKAGLPNRSGRMHSDEDRWSPFVLRTLTKDLDETLSSIAELNRVDAGLSGYVSERL